MLVCLYVWCGGGVGVDGGGGGGGGGGDFHFLVLCAFELCTNLIVWDFDPMSFNGVFFTALPFF